MGNDELFCCIERSVEGAIYDGTDQAQATDGGKDARGNTKRRAAVLTTG